MDIESLWLEISCILPMVVGSIDDKVVNYHGRVTMVEDDETDRCVGNFQLTHLPVSYDQDGDTSTAAYVMDSESGMTAYLHHEIERHLHEIEKDADGVLSVYYLSNISITDKSNQDAIATALLYRLMSTWPATGIGDVLFVDCVPEDEDNELERARLRAFYRKMGFRPLGDSFLYFPMAYRAPVPDLLRGKVIEG